MDTNESVRTKRKPELSLMNAALCVMVIFIHLLSEAVVGLPRGSGRWWLVYVPWTIISMAVYGFLFLSGLKSFLRKEPEPLGTYYRKRFLSVIVPYLVAVTVYYVAYHFAFGYPFTLGKAAQFYLLGTISSHTYFIVALFQFILLMPLWRALVRRCNPTVLFAFACFATLAFRPVIQAPASVLPGINGGMSVWTAILNYTDRIFLSYLAVWTLGCLAGANYDRWAEYLTERKNAIHALFLAVTAIYFALLWFSEKWSVAIGYFGVVQLAFYVSAILELSGLTLRLADTKLPDGRVVRWIDRNSYHIYLYHMIVLIAAQGLCNRLSIQAVGLRLVIALALICVVTPLICEALNFVRKRLNFKGKTS